MQKCFLTTEVYPKRRKDVIHLECKLLQSRVVLSLQETLNHTIHRLTQISNIRKKNNKREYFRYEVNTKIWL